MNPQDQKNSFIIPIIIVVIGMFIAVAVYINSRDNVVQKPVDNADNSAIDNINLSPVTEKDHILGNIDADIIIVEYSDTECPFCKNFHKTMNKIIGEYGNGKVAWVYRHFPLDSLHPKSRKEAEATECAAELGGNTGFWDYLNKIFEITPSNNGLNLTLLPQIAEEIGLDREAFIECLDSGRYAQTVEDQLQTGLTAGVRGTPHSIVITKKDGKRYSINGAQPYASVRQIIEAGLAPTPIPTQKR